MSLWRGVAAGALGVRALSCGPAAAGEASGWQAQLIVAGEPSGTEQDGVLLLRALWQDTSEVLCTASLVAPNLILTAQHCVSYTTEGQFSCSVQGELIDNPTGGGRVGLQLPAANLEVYAGKLPRKAPLARGQQVISTLAPTLCENDLAFVVLDSALDLPVLPLRLGRPAESGELAVLVGYGMSEDEQPINYKTQPRQQKRDLEVTAVGPDFIEDGVTTVPPRVLLLEGPSGCIGDSGGPLLAEGSGAVLGVYSLQSGGTCLAPGVRHHLVHVPAFQTLIDDAFLAAGSEPVPEPQPTAGGAADAGGASSTPDENAGNGSVEATAAAGGAGAEDVVAPSNPQPRSGCSVAASPGGQPQSFSVATLLALAVSVARRADRRRQVLARRAQRARARVQRE